MKARFGDCLCLTEGDQYGLLLFFDLVGRAKDYNGCHDQKRDSAEEAAQYFSGFFRLVRFHGLEAVFFVVFGFKHNIIPFFG